MSGTRIAVAGATGRVGRHIVEVAQERGHDVVPMARSLGVDVISGEGLDQALTGVDVIIDAATGPSAEQDEATTSSPPPPATCRPRASGRGATDGGGVDHRRRPLLRGLRRRHLRPRADRGGGPDPDPGGAGGPVPRVRPPAHGVGHAGRQRLRAGHVDPGGGGPHRRRGAGRRGHGRVARLPGAGRGGRPAGGEHGGPGPALRHAASARAEDRGRPHPRRPGPEDLRRGRPAPRPGCPAGRPHVRGVAGPRLEPGHPGGRGRRPP